MAPDKYKLIACLLVFFGLLTNAQQDEKATKILEDLSSEIMSAPSVTIEFSIEISSLKDEVIENIDGLLVMKKDKYKLDLMETISYFDGEARYTYMPDVNEVIITDPDEEGGLMSNPAKLFTLYNEEFKYRLIGEVERSGQELYEIDLHPIDISRDFHTVKLFIEKASIFLHSAVIAGKDGNRYTFYVNDYNKTKKLNDTFFQFKETDYPGVEVIDMRW